MTESPIRDNPQILQALYKKYGYLMDLPCELKGCLIDDATHFGTLQTDNFLGFVMAYVEQINDHPVPDYYPFLQKEDNLKLSHYRHLRPVKPHPQPIVGVSFDQHSEVGSVEGTHRVDVMLNEIGNAQLWWGEDVAVIFEAMLYKSIQQEQEFEAIIHQLWTMCEAFLKAQGIQRIYTHNHDPEFDTQWYQGFLERRGYRTYDDRFSVVVKTLS